MKGNARQQLSRDELEALVREYRHLREEHGRAHAEGRVRRRLEARLRALERQFERLVNQWLSERLQAEWREHLYADAPEPSEPAPTRALVFRGRDASGSVVAVLRRADGDCDVEVNGRLTERLEGPFDVPAAGGPGTLTLEGHLYDELFAVSESALEALADFVAEREAAPPWQFARELSAEGLVDRSFALTARGRRALATARG